MKKSLIVLVTKSDNDWAVLREKCGFPKEQGITYLECDNGTQYNSQPIECERLLCVITPKDREKNTSNVNSVLVQCNGYDTVIGTHSNSPANVLDVSQLPNTPRTQYSTGENQFVEDWCKELAKATPDSQKVKDGFDRLWKLLDIPYKLEAYLNAMLNLAFDNKPGAEAAIREHNSDIQEAASDSEQKAWEDIKKDIERWDASQRDAMIKTLNRKFFKFAEKELIEHYPYLSDLE